MPADVVLLIDLENMIGANARPGTLAAKLDALAAQAPPGVPAVAACAGNRITPAGKQALKDRKIKLLTVSGDKDAADKALLDEADKLAHRGCTRFIVASHDSRFAQLAGLGQLEIIAWANPKIAQKYTSQAVTVHYVDRPAPSPAAKLAQPAKTQPGSAPTDPAQALAAAAPGAQPRATTPRVTIPAAAAAAGAGVLTAGILFGAGTILGAAAIARLLRPASPPAPP